MSKRARLVLAAVGVLLSVPPIVLAALQIPQHYVLPPTEPGGPAVRRTTTFQPAENVTVVAAIIAVLMVGWLLLNRARAPKTMLWLAPIVLLVIGYGLAFWLLGADRPTF